MKRKLLKAALGCVLAVVAKFALQETLVSRFVKNLEKFDRNQVERNRRGWPFL
jgi:hypothetical protein